MIDSLCGRVLHRGISELVLQVGGFAFRLRVPLHVCELACGPDEELRLYTTLRIADDQYRLFGFESAQERNLFESLIGVSGVGPATGLGLLSGLSQAAIIAAVRSKDPKPLKAVKGIGTKTAERIVVDLQGRLPALDAPSDQARVGSPQRNLEDAVLALISLGFKEKISRKAVDKASNELGEGEPVSQLVRAALRYTR